MTLAPARSAQKRRRCPCGRGRVQAASSALPGTANSRAVVLPIDELDQVSPSAVAPHLGAGVIGKASIGFLGHPRKDGPALGVAQLGQAVDHRVELHLSFDADRGVSDRHWFGQISDLEPRTTAPFSLDLVPGHHRDPAEKAFRRIEAVRVAQRLHGGRLQGVVDRVLGRTSALECSADPLADLGPGGVPVQRQIAVRTEIVCYRGAACALR